MAEWIHILCILSFIVHLAKTESYITFISDTELNHLTVDENTGFVYVGAVNHLYQLTRELGLSFNVSTGPKKDDKQCTPPIDQYQCPTAFLRDNYNKLLLLDVPKERIVVCGSLFQGICSLRKMINISEEISYDDSRGEKSFVASNDEKVETVGLIADMTDYGPRVLFVGKGTSPHDNGIIISTRILDGILDEMGDNGSFETYHDSANLKYGSVSANTQQFITVFEDPDRVYFISSRLDKTSHKSRTLISRLCKSDYNYFSYVEMDLGCRDADNIPYDICTAAFLASPGQELADLMGLSSVQDKVLFGVFTTFINNQEKSAVCMFPLSKINQKFEQNREECYTSNKECANQDSECIFTKPFGEKISCGKQPSQAGESLKYPCGSEHLPYPLQSKNGVTENAVLFPERHPFTAIAVSVENEHTIVFLGTAEGELVKAYLGKSANQYRTVSFPTKSSVKNGMVFDALKEHLYVMTKRKVHRVPVQECQQYLDCNECIQAKDPYCGWCVIEGKCLRKAQCARANDPNHWLWSPGGVCMKIQSVSPSNMSINDLGEVKLTVEPPIKLHYDDKLMCNFGGNVQAALLDEDGSISCPRLETVPSTERGKDYVDVAITLHFLKDKNSVFFANYSYQFYNCEESAYISENVPCSSCVNAKWKCQWDVGLYKCVDFLGYTHETISMESSCPQFNDPKPQFIPMNRQTTITFSGMNLHLLQSENFIAGNDNLNPKLRSSIQKNGDTFSLTLPQFSIQDKEIVPLDIFILNKENEKKVDSKLNVKLYNCFFGRSDCSLCLAANAEYNCAWCDNKCAYEPTCNNSPVSECPAPYITDFQPKAAPVDGGILLTIMGSNLGVKSEDIEEISVAGVICTFRPDMYSVSTRVVCAVGRASKEKAGNIQIKVKGKEGVSPDSLTFSYQVHSGPRNRARGQRKRKKDGDGLSSSIPKRTISFCKKDCTEIS